MCSHAYTVYWSVQPLIYNIFSILGLFFIVIFCNSHNVNSYRNFLLFGDSLTVGTTASCNSTHPYAIRLKQLIQGSHLDAELIISAHPGERTLSMDDRIRQELEMYNPAVTIVMGGTNDILHGDAAFYIFQRLQNCYRKVLLRASFLVAITIPPDHWHKIMPTRDAKRSGINVSIKTFIEKCTDRAALVDMDAVFLGLNDSARSKDLYYSADGVHFSPKGYDLLGELIHKALLNNTMSDLSVDLSRSDSACFM